MKRVLTEQGREVALAGLRERRANRPEKIDDAKLPAGSPMHFYCISCGWLAEQKPENWYRHLPRKLCPECEAMKELGWLE